MIIVRCSSCGELVTEDHNIEYCEEEYEREWHETHDEANEDLRDGTTIPLTDMYDRK